MPYLLLAIAVVIGLVLLVRGLVGADPRNVRRIFKWSAIVIGVSVLAYLAVTGRLALLGWVGAALLPFLMRLRALRRMAKSWRGPTPGQSSDVETAYLRMRLDHDTGELEGTILRGRFQGRLLEELAPSELMALLHECRLHDEQSAAILETYMDRVHGAAWRAEDGGDAGARPAPPPGGASMSEDEAYEILGLERGADADEIRDAHRRLMLKIHPDQGGSTYLAAKINQAKELLLARATDGRHG